MTEVSHWSIENVTEELLVHLHRVLLRDCSLNPQSIWEKLAVRGVMFWKLHAYLPNSKMNNISKKYFYLTFYDDTPFPIQMSGRKNRGLAII